MSLLSCRFGYSTVLRDKESIRWLVLEGEYRLTLVFADIGELGRTIGTVWANKTSASGNYCVMTTWIFAMLG